VSGPIKVEGHELRSLDQGWQLASMPPGSAADPAELHARAPAWLPAERLGTVAAILRAAGRFSLDGPGRRFDAEDWWYRGSIPALALAAGERAVLCFDGLATAAEVWLDGAPLLSSNNMFVAHELDVSAGAGAERELLIRFRALDELLKARKPRPRWRAPMIEHQQLRWHRTTLLGRTPGWSPGVAAVGPWRPVRLERRRGLSIERVRIDPVVDGESGRLEVALQLRSLDERGVTSARLCVEGSGTRVEVGALLTDATGGVQQLRAEARIKPVARWWPHTHGEQPLYTVSLLIEQGAQTRAIELGKVGFRELALHAPEPGDDFRITINGQPVFWRGACWTPLDVVSLSASPADYREALEAVRAAGMNMLRVVGSMTYELDAFYDLCDELGIALWHDLMFANMDYPEDEPFVAGVRTELTQLFQRLAGRPALLLVCGDSEGEQQAAMWGAPRTGWERPLFQRTLPAWVAELRPDVPYWPSSSSGRGAYPHQVNAGPTSYYGVGAYLRPLDDARRSEVRFASECLAFANVPEPSMLDALGGERTLHAHSPRWKARSPRDLGAGWDFDDVRDHYLRVLFGHDPMTLRYADHERYVALGRVTSGEVMAAAFAEWRRRRSSCGGALVWFLRDLWPGAGWGVIDARGRPKAAFHYLRRALQPIGLAFSDEGLSGLYAHLWNERPNASRVELGIELFRHHEQLIHAVRVPLELAPRAVTEHAVSGWLPGFMDLTRAFRFGPPAVDLVVGSLRDQRGGLLGQSFYFPLGLPAQPGGDLGLGVEARALAGGDYELTVRSRRFAQSIAIDAGAYRPDDAYFHVSPGGERRVRLRAPGPGSPPPSGSVMPLNAHVATPIAVPAEASPA
jgi:beta-mannosidase